MAGKDNETSDWLYSKSRYASMGIFLGLGQFSKININQSEEFLIKFTLVKILITKDHPLKQ